MTPFLNIGGAAFATSSAAQASGTISQLSPLVYIIGGIGLALFVMYELIQALRGRAHVEPYRAPDQKQRDDPDEDDEDDDDEY